MDLAEALLDSWARQCRIVEAVASRIDESNRHVKPSEDGWPLDQQLAHIHQTRCYWLKQAAPESFAALGHVFEPEGKTATQNLDVLRARLDRSGQVIAETMRGFFDSGAIRAGAYDHPVLFLQHMIWHEGWHVGLIFLGLRLAGQEPPEEWEEARVWGEWRTEEF